MHRMKTLLILAHCLWFACAQISAAIAGATPEGAQDTPAPSTTEKRVETEASCQTPDETEFRSTLEALILRSLTTEMNTFDYRSAVRVEWQKLEMGKTLSEEVDRTMETLRSEMSWGALLQSLSNSDKARELATMATERVYHSDPMKESLQELATGVGRSLGTHMEVVLQDATLPALTCLHQYLRSRYGSAVASALTQSVREDFELKPQNAASAIEAGGLLKEASGGVAGAALLIMRRQLMTMTERLGQRIVGSVLSRLVSVVAGSVGLALIAKDMWDLRYGLLPIIGEEMKSEDTQSKVQAELAQSLSEQIGVHAQEISTRTTERIFAIWSAYRSAHTLVLNLAAEKEGFRTFLDTIPPQMTPRLDEMTALVHSSEGDAGVLQRVQNGTLKEAIEHLPDPALDIARQTRSLDLALEWTRLAGDNLDLVVRNDLYQRAPPSAFTPESLKKILALENPLLMKRIVRVSPTVRDQLFELDAPTLSAVVTTYTEQDLGVLGSYLSGLQPSTRAQFVSLVTRAPRQFEVLKSPSVRDALLGSANQPVALDMLLASPDTFSWMRLKRDVEAVLEGEVEPYILWSVHPKSVVLGILGCLFVLLLVRRLVRPSRLRRAP